MNEPKPTVCPYCKSRGVRMRDTWDKDGTTFEWFYCGVCGKNITDDNRKIERSK